MLSKKKRNVLSLIISFCIIFIFSNVYASQSPTNSTGVGSTICNVGLFGSTQPVANADYRTVGFDAITSITPTVTTCYLQTTASVYDNGVKIDSPACSASNVINIDLPKTYTWVYGDYYTFYTTHYCTFLDPDNNYESLTGYTSGWASCVF